MSSKGFEAAGFMAAVPELIAAGFVLGAIRCDGDVAMLAALKRDPKYGCWTAHEIQELLCKNQCLKNNPKHLMMRLAVHI